MKFVFLTEPSVSIFMIRVVLGIILFAHVVCSRCTEGVGLVWGSGAQRHGCFLQFDGDATLHSLPCLLARIPERYRSVDRLPGAPLRPGCCGNHGGCHSNRPSEARLVPQRGIKAGAGAW